MNYDELIELIEGDDKSVEDFHLHYLPLMQQMPASLKGHHSYVGGYYDHILEVMNNALAIYKLLDSPDFTLSDLLLAAYIHDLDKLLYRYEICTDPPTEKQLSYARSLGCHVMSSETKSTISEKINAKKEGREYDKGLVNPYQSRSDGMYQEDSGIVMHLCHEHGIEGINPTVLHAVCFHHGGFNPYASCNPNITLQPIAKVLHSADLISTVQNGNK